MNIMLVTVTERTRKIGIRMALGFSAGVGLFCGLWPARKAAKMGPIAALRYE